MTCHEVCKASEALGYRTGTGNVPLSTSAGYAKNMLTCWFVRYGPARPKGLPQLRTPLDLPAKGYMLGLRPPDAAVATQLIELREAASGSGVGDSRGSGGVWVGQVCWVVQADGAGRWGVLRVDRRVDRSAS